jgi:hypothetical protein
MTSSPLPDDDEFDPVTDPVLQYAPRAVREGRAQANRPSAQPIEPPPPLLRGRQRDTGRAFSGDRAVLELQRQLSLDPTEVPQPPSLTHGQPVAQIVLRLAGVAGVAAIAAWFVISISGGKRAEPQPPPVAASTADRDSAPTLALAPPPPPLAPSPPAVVAAPRPAAPAPRPAVASAPADTVAAAAPAAAASAPAAPVAAPARVVAAPAPVAAAPAPAPPQAAPPRPTAAVPPAVVTPPAPPAPPAPAAANPERAAANEQLRVALEANTARAAPVAAPPPAPPSLPKRSVPRLDDREISTLIRRGESFLANGDLASGRLFLQRAAEAGSAAAALELATTFDPLTIDRFGAVGGEPDAAQARKWYQKAIELGSDAAARQLAKLTQSGQ